MSLVIGIDAGGTKTVGLLADGDGKILAEARGGSANLHVQGELGVEKVLYQVIDDLRPPGPIDAICLGMAGVDRPEERQVVDGVLCRLRLQRVARVENDAFIALVAGSPRRIGIAVLAGTGSMAYGIDASGKIARSGGWGYLLGDEGSAYWLGHAAVRRAIRAADGRGPDSSLVERIAERLDLEVPAGLVSWFYDQDRFRYRVAELASLVEEAAQDGDEAARDLLTEAAQHLARAARAVERRLDFSDTYPLVLVGGAFRACPSLQHRIEGILDLPRARVARLEIEPANGAVALALDLLERNRAAR